MKEREMIAREYIAFLEPQEGIEPSETSLRDFLTFNWPNELPNLPQIMAITREVLSSKNEGSDGVPWEGFEVIATYSRSQAILDGVLVDEPLTQIASREGIHLHCAMTDTLFRFINRDGERDNDDLRNNLNSMVREFRNKAKGSNRDVLYFNFPFVGRDHESRELEVKVTIGPGDDEAPVLTFMLPEED